MTPSPNHSPPSHSSVTTRSPISRMPEELLSQVFEYLRFDPEPELDEWMDFHPAHALPLRNACLTAKAWQRVATPILYRHVGMDLVFRAAKSALGLLRTLMERPDLAAYVKTIEIPGRRNIPLPLTSLTPELVEQCERTVAESPLSDSLKQELQHGIKVGWDDSAVAILLLKCTHLRKLLLKHTDILYDWEETMPLKMIKEVVAASQASQGERVKESRDMPLSGVECLHVSYSVDPMGRSMPLHKIAPIFRLPAFKSLRCWGATLDSMSDDPILPGSCRNIKHLSFELTDLSANCIATFLQACPEIQTLFVSWNWDDHGEFYELPDSVGEVIDEVKEHGSQLRLLEGFGSEPDEIWSEELGQTVRPPMQGARPIRSLRDLDEDTKVRRLTARCEEDMRPGSYY